MLALTFEILNATLGTLIGQIRSGVEQADKAQKASLALGQSLGGFTKQLTLSDKLQKNFNKSAKDSAARTESALRDVRKGTDELARSLNETTVTMDRLGSVTRTSFSESVSKLNEDFTDLVSKGVIDRDQPIKELMADQFRGDFTQRLGVVFEGLRAGIELDEINGSI